MPFLLGSFTSGLFGGMKAVSQIADEWEGLKQHRLETQREQSFMDAAKAVQSATTAGSDSQDSALPQGTYSGGDTSSRYVKPDLDSVPQPKFLVDRKALPAPTGDNSSPREGSPFGPSTPPNYLAPTTGMMGDSPREGAPFGTPAAQQAAQPGALIWTSGKGLHRAAAGETGFPLSGALGSAAGAIGNTIGNLRFDPSRGLYAVGSAVDSEINPAAQAGALPIGSPQIYQPPFIPAPVQPGEYIEPPPK